MKKILTTLTVIAATALGAQGQTSTNTFPVNTNSVSFSGLSFGPAGTDIPNPYIRAKLLFGVSGVDFGDSGSVRFTNITVSGQNIAANQNGGRATATPDTGIITVRTDADQYASTATFQLTGDLDEWNSSDNRVTFTAQFLNGASASVGSQLYYAIQYQSSGGSQVNTAFGSTALVAVPEPSTYAAAAGLLALFLWSSRRHLFKLAGARSSASGPDENGAA